MILIKFNLYLLFRRAQQAICANNIKNAKATQRQLLHLMKTTA